MGRSLVATLAAAGILLTGAACSDDGGDDADAAEVPAEVVDGDAAAADEDGAEPADGEAAATDEDGAESVDGETTTTGDELTMADIRAHLEEEHPDEAALVDWDIIRWVGGFGYTATVPEGTGDGEAVAVCEALAEIVYAHADDAIAVVAGPDEAPLADREGPDGTCAPAA